MVLDDKLTECRGVSLHPLAAEDIHELVRNLHWRSAMEMAIVYGVEGDDKLIEGFGRAGLASLMSFSVCYKGEVMAIIGLNRSLQLWGQFSKRAFELRAIPRMIRCIPALMEYLNTSEPVHCNIWEQSDGMIELMNVAGFQPTHEIDYMGHKLIRFFYCGRDGLQGNEKAPRPVAH